MKLARTVVAVCVFLLAATVATAQTGGMRIVVTDAEGAPLPGATVTISHETGSIKTTTELTDKRGMVEFPVLRPGGGYSIQVSFPGLSPIRYDDLRVKLSSTLPLSIQMMEEIQERVTVRAESEVVDLDKSEQSTRFSDEFISDLPVAGRFYQNVLTMAPGVQDADGDGNPNVHGSRSRDFQAVVGNVSNVDPLTGQWLSRINTNSIEEMEVITAGAGVEFGRAQGGFARIIQKQGSNTHEGVVEFYWRTSKLDGDGANDNDSLPSAEFDSFQPSFQFSGPLVKDKLWYRVSYELIDDETPVNVLSGIETVTRERETQDAMVTWQVSPRNKLAFQGRADPDQANNFGVSSRVSPESARRFERDVDTWTLTWTAPYSPKVLVETTLAWQDINNFTGPTKAGLKNNCVPNAKETFLSGAYCDDQTNSLVSGSWWRDEDDRRQRFTFKGQATVYGGRFWGMTHEFKLGLNVENERYFRDLVERPVINYQVVSFLDNEDTGSGGTGGGDGGGGGGELVEFGLVLARLSVPSEDEVRATGTNWAVYAEDQFKPAQNLTITVGARMDREELNSEGRVPFSPIDEYNEFQDYIDGVKELNGSTQAAEDAARQDWPLYFTAYEDILGFQNELAEATCRGLPESQCNRNEIKADVDVQLINDVADQGRLRSIGNINISNTNISPFLSVAWSPFSNGKTALKASVGRYYNNLPLLIPLQELEPTVVINEYRASLETQCDPPLSCETNEDCTGTDVCIQGICGSDANNIPTCGQVLKVGKTKPQFSISTVDRSLRTPYQDEFTFKFERELWAETSLSLTYINRQFKDQVQDVNINVDVGDFGRCRFQTQTQKLPIEPSDQFSNINLNQFGKSSGVCSGWTLDSCELDGDCSGGGACIAGFCSTSIVICDQDSECPSGQACNYDLYDREPEFFCSLDQGLCLSNPFGAAYPDRAAGPGDGYIDPATGSVFDNCVGATVSASEDEDCAGDPFCLNLGRFERPDDTSDLYVQNFVWGDIYLIGNFNEIDYEAFVLELVRRQYRSWEMNASYTWSEATGDGEDFFQALGDDPTLRDSVTGFQSYDQTHVVKLNATTITPWGVRLGSSVTWQSGLPYSLLFQDFAFDSIPPTTQVFNQQNNRPRQAYLTDVRNDQRNKSYWNVDLRATKELRLGKGLNLQVSAEVFNLLNDDTYQVYNPFFERGQQLNGRNEAQRRFGRRWQMGMKLAF